MEPVTIIGNGVAGVTLARELRKLDTSIGLRIVTLDDGHFYSKPTLSNALARGKRAEQLVVTTRDALEKELNAEVLPRTRVEEIRSAACRLVTSGGELGYSRLVLASGARPIRLPIQGDGAADILSVNSLDDYDLFHRRLDGRRHVALIGAGLIGCEFANDLRLAGFDVTVFDIADQPLGRLLPPMAAAWLAETLSAAGVVFRFGRGVSRVDRNGGGYRLTDDRGDRLDADLVLSVVGLAPSIDLAKTAGLETHRGIVTDRFLQSSTAGIYALGDGVEVEGLHLPYVAPILLQAKALAATLTGTPTALAYPPMPVTVKTPACPTVVCPPPFNAAGQWTEEVTPEGVRSVFSDSAGRTLGFALLGTSVAKRASLMAELPPLLRDAAPTPATADPIP